MSQREPEVQESDRELRDLLRAYKPTLRDKIAVRLANGVLRVVASREYRTIVWRILARGYVYDKERA